MHDAACSETLPDLPRADSLDAAIYHPINLLVAQGLEACCFGLCGRAIIKCADQHPIAVVVLAPQFEATARSVWRIRCIVASHQAMIPKSSASSDISSALERCIYTYGRIA